MDKGLFKADIKSISKTKAPFFVKFGVITTFKDQLPNYVGLLAHAIGNLQILSIICFTAITTLERDSKGMYDIVFSINRVISPMINLNFENGSTSLFIVFLIVTMNMSKNVIISSQLTYSLLKKKLVRTSVQRAWSLYCYLHPTILFYYIHGFSVSIIYAYHEGELDIFKSRGLSLAICIISYLYSLINLVEAKLQIYFCRPIIMTNDPLDSKNTSIQILDLGFKFTIPLLWVVDGGRDSIHILSMVFMVLFCILRDFALFKYLPFYRIDVLQLQTISHALTTGFTIGVASAYAFRKTTYKTGLSYGIVIGVVMGLILIKAYLGILASRFRKILYSKTENLPADLIVHKHYIFQYLEKNRKQPHSKTRIIDKQYFAYRFQLVGLIQEGLLNEDECMRIDLDPNLEEYVDKAIATSVKRSLLKGLQLYPKSTLLKAALASHYIHHEGNFLLSNNILEELLKTNGSTQVYITMFLIRLDIQKKLLQQYGKGDAEGASFNMRNYIEMNQMNENLKGKIREQLVSQNKFWELFLLPKPKMYDITKEAKKAYKKRKEVMRYWKKFEEVHDKNFKSPYLTFGTYQSLANNDTIDGDKLIEDYYKKFVASKRDMNLDELSDATLFSQDNILIKLSGSKKKLGQMEYVSPTFKTILGVERDLSHGKNVSVIMSNYFREKHDGFLLNYYNSGESKFLNKTMTLPFMTGEGYIVPCWTHVKADPRIEEGISFVGLVRPRKFTQRMILIREDGTVDGFTKHFADDLGIHTLKDDREFKLANLCPEFEFINAAFNEHAYDLIQQKTNYQKKQKKHSSQSTNSGPIKQSSYNSSSQPPIPTPNGEEKNNYDYYSTNKEQQESNIDDSHNVPQDEISTMRGNGIGGVGGGGPDTTRRDLLPDKNNQSNLYVNNNGGIGGGYDKQIPISQNQLNDSTNLIAGYSTNRNLDNSQATNLSNIENNMGNAQIKEQNTGKVYLQGTREINLEELQEDSSHFISLFKNNNTAIQTGTNTENRQTTSETNANPGYERNSSYDRKNSSQEFKTIFEQFSSGDGGKLTFQISHNLTTSMRKMAARQNMRCNACSLSIEYNVKIFQIIHGKDFIKILTLEKIRSNQDDYSQSSNMSPNASLKKRLKKGIPTDEMYKKSGFTSSSQQHKMNEKGAQQPLSSQQIELMNRKVNELVGSPTHSITSLTSNNKTANFFHGNSNNSSVRFSNPPSFRGHNGMATGLQLHSGDFSMEVERYDQENKFEGRDFMGSLGVSQKIDFMNADYYNNNYEQEESGAQDGEIREGTQNTLSNKVINTLVLDENKISSSGKEVQLAQSSSNLNKEYKKNHSKLPAIRIMNEDDLLNPMGVGSSREVVRSIENPTDLDISQNKTATFQKRNPNMESQSIKNVQQGGGGLLQNRYLNLFLRENLKKQKLLESHHIEFLDEEIKEFKANLNNNVMDFGGQIESSINSTASSKGRKVQKAIARALTEKKYGRWMKLYNSLFWILNFAYMALLILISIIVILTLNSLLEQVEVIEKTHFRNDRHLFCLQNLQFLKGTQNGMIVLSGNFAIDSAFPFVNLRESIPELIKAHSDLSIELPGIRSDLQGIFFDQKVKMNSVAQDQTRTHLYNTNNMHGYQILIDKVKKKFAQGPAPSQVNFDPELEFIIDNSLNDLIVSSWNNTQLLQSELLKTSDNTQSNMLYINITTIVIVVAFIGVSVKYMVMVNSDSIKFMNVLYKISSGEAQGQKHSLEVLSNIMNKNYEDLDLISEIQDAQNEAYKKGEQRRTETFSGKKIYRSADMTHIHRKERVIFASTLPFMAVMIGAMLIWYFSAISNLKKMSQQSKEISFALETLTFSTITVDMMIRIVLTNDTAKVYDVPIQQAFVNTIQPLINVNEFVNNFKDSNGQFTPIQQEILYGYPCSKMHDPRHPNITARTLEAQRECRNFVTVGNDSIALVHLLAKYETSTRQFIQEFNASSKTEAELRQVFLNGNSKFEGLSENLDRLLKILQIQTSIEFRQTKDSVASQSQNWAIGAVPLVAFICIVQFFFIIKRVLRKDIERKRVLQILPIRFLLTNRFLKNYLVEITGDSLQAVKRMI